MDRIYLTKSYIVNWIEWHIAHSTYTETKD